MEERGWWQSCLFSGRGGRKEGLPKLEVPDSEAGGLGPGDRDGERTSDRLEFGYWVGASDFTL